MMAKMIILTPSHPMVKVMFPAVGKGGFDFGEEVRARASGLEGGKPEGAGDGEGVKRKKGEKKKGKKKKKNDDDAVQEEKEKEMEDEWLTE